jgi:hypothetical protein
MANQPSNLEPGRASMPVTVARLTRAFQLTRGLTRALGGWMAAVDYWDAKLAMGDQLWAYAQSGADLLRRLHELKESSAERQDAAAVEALLFETMCAGTGDDFLQGMHGTLLPRCAQLAQQWSAEADPVMDPLSRRLFSELAARLREHAQWYESFAPQYSPAPPRRNPAWSAWIGQHFDAIDFDTGRWLAEPPAGTAPANRAAFEVIPVPRRDACFDTRWFNEVSRRSGDSFEERRRTIFYNHTQEMQFAESLGAILYQTPEMPWAFHFDLARHCTDEIRHTRMGCTRLAQLGEDLRTFPMLLQNYSVRAKLEPIDRFCLMTLVIEAGSFEKKRANVKEFGERGDSISERYESYDIRDEMMHVNFGHTWVPIMLRVTRDPRSVNELIAHCRDILEDALKDERRAG